MALKLQLPSSKKISSVIKAFVKTYNTRHPAVAPVDAVSVDRPR